MRNHDEIRHEEEIAYERMIQKKLYDEEHDDALSAFDWQMLVERHLREILPSQPLAARRRWIKIAATALAALEVLDRSIAKQRATMAAERSRQERELAAAKSDEKKSTPVDGERALAASSL